MPLNVHKHLSATQSLQTTEEKKAYLEYAKGLVYIQAIRLVIYATQTCPDILHTVGVLSQFSANPCKAHLKLMKHILRYLKGMAHFALVLGHQGVNRVDLVGWTESD